MPKNMIVDNLYTYGFKDLGFDKNIYSYLIKLNMKKTEVLQIHAELRTTLDNEFPRQINSIHHFSLDERPQLDLLLN